MSLDGQHEIVYSVGVNIIKYGALLAGFSALVACQSQQSQHEQSEQQVSGPPPLHLGAVHQVFPDQGFATLRFIGPVPPAGTTLITHPPDGSNSRVGNLQLPLDRQVRNSYVVATIRSGVVFQGDRVFMYRNVGQADSSAQRSESDHNASHALPGDGSQLGSPDAGSIGIAQPSSTASTPSSPPVDVAFAGATSGPQIPAVDSLQPLPVQQPEEVPAQPTPQPPRRTATPGNIPDYLNDIPDNINDWD